MSYVKISDPNIIDIAAWQQLINVVNQHSDSITAITNNFNGVGSSAVDWTAGTFSHVWDPGSQALVYGRIAADTGVLTPVSTGLYWGEGSFSDAAISSSFQFSSIPIVTATLYSGHATSGNVSPDNKKFTVTVYDINTAGFKWRLSSVDGTAPTSGAKFYINWTALGPR